MDTSISFHEFCARHDATDKERFELAHHLAAMRYQRTLLVTLGADIKPVKAVMKGLV